MTSLLSNNSFVTSGMLELSNKDYVTMYKNKIVNSYSTLKINNPKKSVSEIARELNISTSSLKKIIQESGFDLGRKKHQYSTEEKQNIAIKGTITRQRRKAIKEDIEKIKSSDLSAQEQVVELENLQNRMSTTSLKSEITKPMGKKKKNTIKAGSSHVQFPQKLLDDPTTTTNASASVEFSKQFQNTQKRDRSPLQEYLADREKPISERYNIDEMMQTANKEIMKIIPRINE